MAGANIPYLDGLNGAASLLEDVGKERFPAQMLKVLEPAVHVDHIVVFTFSLDGKPGWLLTHGSVPPDHAFRLANQYVGSYHELDPGLPIVRTFNAGSNPQVFAFDRHRVNSQRYWETFYKNSNLIDKMSILHEHRGTKYLCNYYRASVSGHYNTADKAALRRLAPLLSVVISLHGDALHKVRESQPISPNNGKFSNTPDVWSGQDGSPFAKLSNREREICRLVLIGFSTEGMALDLGLSVNTIKTYRRRAYKKLGIVSANELHWMFHTRRPTG